MISYIENYGEECEFSDDKENWHKNKFVAYRPNSKFLPYTTEYNEYKYCRPLPKTKTITIDGKSIKISLDSFEALKKQLCEG